MAKDKNNTIVEHKVNFLVGDWNMSLPQVVPRLTKLGLRVDLCSWYPWLHDTDHGHGYDFGMDSMAMFHIGGDVHCQLKWDFDKIGDILLEASRDPSHRPRSRHDKHSLDRYAGKNVPGKQWNCFKNKKKEKGSVDLKTKLEGLLAPSTTRASLEALRADPTREVGGYLKLKQKHTQQGEWLLDPVTGAVHKGAHFPLLMFTDNTSARSKEAEARRKAKWQPWSMRQANKDAPAWLQQGDAPASLSQMQSPVAIVPAEQAQAAVAADDEWRRSRWVEKSDGGGWDWSSGWSAEDWSSGWSHSGSGRGSGSGGGQ